MGRYTQPNPVYQADSKEFASTKDFHVSVWSFLDPELVTFVPSLTTVTALALALPSFTEESSFFPSALPIFSNSCANVARGGAPKVSPSSASSPHAGDGDRFGAVGVWACALALDLPVRGGPKRRRGVQSSDGEKSGCSG